MRATAGRLGAAVGATILLGVLGGPDAEAAVYTPDAYKCYGTSTPTVSKRLTLQTQFEKRRARTTELNRLCNPAQVQNVGMRAPDAHLACYDVRGARSSYTLPRMTIEHRFGIHVFRLGPLQRLCAASLKNLGSTAPSGPAARTMLDDYACYSAKHVSGRAPFNAALTDQFNTGSSRVGRVSGYCSPTQIGGAFARQLERGLICFNLEDAKPSHRPRVTIRDRFGTRTVQTRKANTLCIPGLPDDVDPPEPHPPGCLPTWFKHGKSGSVPLWGPILVSNFVSLEPNHGAGAYSVGKVSDRIWRVRSHHVDGPDRVEWLRLKLRVRYGTPSNVKNAVLVCMVGVQHDAPPPSPAPPERKHCIESARFMVDPLSVPTTGFGNFGGAFNLPGNATLEGYKLLDRLLRLPPDDVFAPSHAWDVLIPPPLPIGGRLLADHWANVYWVDDTTGTPTKPVWRFDVYYSVPAGPCSAFVEFVNLPPGS